MIHTREIVKALIKGMKIFAVLLVVLLPISASAAIARDSTGSTDLTTWQSGTSLSWSHTTSVGLSNYVGIVFTAYNGTISGTPTWGGHNMTQIELYTDADGANFYAYCIVSPPSGAQTISFSYSPSAANLAGVSVVYTGVNPSCSVDSFGNGHVTAGTTFSATTTVVASNAWLTGVFYENQSSGVSGRLNTTILLGNAATTIGLADSNGTVGTGSQSLNYVDSISAHWTGITVSLAPATAASPILFGYFNSFWW